MTQSRRHHYVPQFYLKGFTEHPQEENPQIFAADLLERKLFKPRILNIAVERDFHTVIVDGEPSDEIEQKLSHLEGEVAPALMRTIGAEQFTSSEDGGLVLSYFTLLMLKSPINRDVVNQLTKEILTRFGRDRASNPDAFYSSVRQMIDEGEMPPDSDIEKLRQAILTNEFDISLVTEAHLDLEFAHWNKLYERFVATRRWEGLVARRGSFVTCDRPVALIWDDPRRNAPIGLAHPHTSLLIPLSSSFALRGGFEIEPSTRELVGSDVADVNGRLIRNANRRVFAKDEGFQYRLLPGLPAKFGYELVNEESLGGAGPQLTSG